MDLVTCKLKGAKVDQGGNSLNLLNVVVGEVEDSQLQQVGQVVQTRHSVVADVELLQILNPAQTGNVLNGNTQARETCS